MPVSYFSMAIELNSVKAGNPTADLNSLESGVGATLGQAFSKEEIEAFAATGGSERLAQTGQKIFLTQLQAAASKSAATYYQAEDNVDRFVAIRLLLLARREVVRDKLKEGELPASLVGQDFQADIESKLKAMQALFTVGWRPVGSGYIRENISPENERLLIDIFRVFADKHAAHAYPYKKVGRDHIAISLDQPDTVALTGTLFLYNDNYNVLMPSEMSQSKRKRAGG